MEIVETCKEWNSVFKGTIPGMDKFLDREFSFLCGTPKIDLLKFDDFLRQKYKYDNGRDVSMSNFLQDKFGKDAVSIVEKLL